MEETIDKELAELEQKIAETKAEVKEKEPEVITPEPSAPPAQEATPPVTEKPFDEKQWVEKKGWKTPEDAARSMRALEQEMHRKNQELAQLKAQQSYQPPENPYAGQPPYMPPPVPAYAPPSYGYQPRLTEEQVAASYQLPVEDFRRVFAIARDLTEVTKRQQQQEMNAWREQVTAEATKSSDMASVVSDPAFHNPVVQAEMHEFLSKNPAVMSNPRYMSMALKESLANLGRKNAMGGSPAPSTLPTEPPKGFGTSGTSFSGKRSTGFTTDEANKMTPEQLEKKLKGMGAFKTYEDLAG